MSRFKELEIDEAYRRYFEGILKFGTLNQAEQTIRALDGLYRRFANAGDERGVRYCRDLARLGRQRALGIAKKPSVSQAKQREKEEIALWFTIWADTPDLFFDWLALRKQSPDFIEKFGPT